MSISHERVVVLDTETTGLDKNKDRVVEIGAVEVIGNMETGKHYHQYINPYPVKVDPEALKVHGLTDEMLSKFPKFRSICPDFLDFIGDSPLVIHNADFDIGMLNAELDRLGKKRLTNPVKDTVKIARLKYPGQRVNLDALCARLGVDNSGRELHGALLDASLLAQVYVKMMDLDKLGLEVGSPEPAPLPSKAAAVAVERGKWPARPPLAPTPEEIAAHESFHAQTVKDSIWLPSLKNLLTRFRLAVH